jgi:hypothetical protein
MYCTLEKARLSFGCYQHDITWISGLLSMQIAWLSWMPSMVHTSAWLYVRILYTKALMKLLHGSVPQSNQSAGPVRFLIFCSISIILLASLVAGSRPQNTAGAD